MPRQHGLEARATTEHRDGARGARFRSFELWICFGFRASCFEFNHRRSGMSLSTGMNLSEPFIRRPVMTALLTLSAILFGVLAYQNLPVNSLPAVDYPVIQ